MLVKPQPWLLAMSIARKQGACIRVWNKLTSTQIFIEVGRPRKVHAHASCKVVPRPHPHRQVRHCTAACNDKDRQLCVTACSLFRPNQIMGRTRCVRCGP